MAPRRLERSPESSLRNEAVPSIAPTLQVGFEQPSAWTVRPGLVEFNGWYTLSDNVSLADLALVIGEQSYPVRFGIPRPDGRAAFCVIAPVRRGRHRIRILAQLHDGRAVVREWDQELTAAAPGVGVGLAQKLRAATFPVFAIRKAIIRLASGRGWPTRDELPLLFRAARVDHAREVARTTSQVVGDLEIPPAMDPYDAWLAVNRWNTARAQELRARLAAIDNLPRISVVTPVFRPRLEWFKETADSVRGQVFDAWEWCLADDASGDAALTSLLERLAAEDKRIRFVSRTTNGHISAASNSAAALASGEFLAFLDHDDLLSPDALAEVALYLAAHPDTDVLYTDDDKIDLKGRRFGPQFKPDWSPEALLSQMYMCHLLVIRRSLFESLGGFRIGLEGSQDHDLALRATERARHVGHLPYVLYHWRAVPGSTAAAGDAKPYAYDATIRAVSDALERRGIRAEVERPDWAIRGGIGIVRHRFPPEGPSVAILIATRNQPRLLKRCLDSLAATSYRNYRVVILDDHSDDEETLEYLERLPHEIRRMPGPRTGFNYAALHNSAAADLMEDLLVFLNDDTEVLNPDWLSQLVGFATLPGVGVVGARLIGRDGHLQHAGVLLPFQGAPAAVLGGLESSDLGYLAAAKACRNYSAVTAACLLTPRPLFLRAGGFDANAFPVSYNDVDYCIRVTDLGYRCVYAPEAELLHHGGASRGQGVTAEETVRFRRHYKGRRDAFHNPNLSADGSFFEPKPRRPTRHSSRRPRALMFTHALDFTGAPLCQLELAAGLLERNRVAPLIVTAADGPLRGEYHTRGLDVQTWDAGPEEVDSDDEYERTVARLARLIRDADVDVVVASTVGMARVIDAARRLNIPSVWCIRESEPWAERFRRLPRAARTAAIECFGAPYRVVFDSRACRARYAPLEFRHNFAVVPTGLPPGPAAPAMSRNAARRSLQVEDGDVVVTLVGTVCERKGQHDYVRALGALPPAVAGRLRSFIVGDRSGPYSDELRRLTAALPNGLAARTSLVAETREVTPYLAAADLFVCTSHVESYPRVTLEAMRFGLPVISTPVFGLSEQLADGVNALFVQPGDSAALAEALAQLSSDTDRRARMASQSSVVLASLPDYEDMLEAYELFLTEAAETL